MRPGHYSEGPDDEVAGEVVDDQQAERGDARDECASDDDAAPIRGPVREPTNRNAGQHNTDDRDGKDDADLLGRHAAALKPEPGKTVDGAKAHGGDEIEERDA